MLQFSAGVRVRARRGGGAAGPIVRRVARGLLITRQRPSAQGDLPHLLYDVAATLEIGRPTRRAAGRAESGQDPFRASAGDQAPCRGGAGAARRGIFFEQALRRGGC
jgi:hypothetical protein